MASGEGLGPHLPSLPPLNSPQGSSLDSPEFPDSAQKPLLGIFLQGAPQPTRRWDSIDDSLHLRGPGVWTKEGLLGQVQGWKWRAL